MDYISFSLNYWDDLWQSRHQVMSLLAKQHKVLFVSPPFSRSQVFNAEERKRLPASGVVHRQDNLYTVVFPKYLFEIYKYPWLGKILAYLRERHVRRIAKKLGFRDVVLFVWHPHFADAVVRVGDHGAPRFRRVSHLEKIVGHGVPFLCDDSPPVC